MGRKRKQIVGSKKLIESLNKALADEWLAYYRYWVDAKVVTGEMRKSAAMELEELATEELKHAGMLAEQIIQLNGKPILDPIDCSKIASFVYEEPKDFSVRSILFQNIKGKQYVIDFYKKLIDFVRKENPQTCEMLTVILDEEMEQKDSLVNILEHLEKMT